VFRIAEVKFEDCQSSVPYCWGKVSWLPEECSVLLR
jgi:hypothetical protein